MHIALNWILLITIFVTFGNLSKLSFLGDGAMLVWMVVIFGMGINDLILHSKPCPNCKKRFFDRKIKYHSFFITCPHCKYELHQKFLLEDFKKKFFFIDFSEIKLTINKHKEEIINSLKKTTVKSEGYHNYYTSPNNFKGFIGSDEARLFFIAKFHKADFQLLFKEYMNSTDVLIRFRLYRSYIVNLFLGTLFLDGIIISAAYFALLNSELNPDKIMLYAGVAVLISFCLMVLRYKYKMKYYKKELPRVLESLVDNENEQK